MKKLVVLLGLAFGLVACGDEFTTPLFPGASGAGGTGGSSTGSGGAGDSGSSQGGQAGEGGEITGGGGSGGDAGNTSSGGGGGIGGVAGDAGHSGDAGHGGDAGQAGEAGQGGHAGQGGNGGQAGAGQAGEGGQGGSDPPCSDKEKYCGFVCVSKSDPAYGCADNNCQPCAKLDHASVGCNLNGQCAVAKCDAGFENCNVQDPDGCEINTQNDSANCGACKNACSLTHAQVKCSVGVCEIAQCDSGFDNCNSQHPDGCEVSLKDDPANCGACKNACSTKACEANKCNPLCGPGEKIVSTVGVSLCWIVPTNDKPPGKFLGMGGLMDQPNKPDLLVKPFPGCVAPNGNDEQVVCKLGDVEKGTYFQMQLNAYNDALGKSLIYLLCDESKYPSAKCKGTVKVWRDGVEVVTPFTDPPKPPWSYMVVDGRYELALWLN